ncbi:sugar phosphate isomerase/epimerase family protein [Aquimarina celericrescens]|uniref:Sugar phosphate isomerase/epimerase family protein n=1 Tax=Aquimarina celericrescens TaxID=1964542 RepID=A0ABW5B1F5_9FLAO|nr:sugar phosphate isomerase/epimerase [Aquimarina celericrescens]
MDIKFYYPVWSIGELPLEEALYKIKKNGYDGAEIAIREDQDLQYIQSVFKDQDLELLAQHPFAEGTTFDEYQKDFSNKLRKIQKLQPVHINCHTGNDYFSFEQNKKLLLEAIRIEKENSIKISHEIHRGRFSFAPLITKQYIDQIQELKLTADYSHWCVVTESLLENFENVLKSLASNIHHIHARVGFEEAPQVNDPFAPEHRYALERHLQWWQQILNTYKKNQKGALLITCEFGPKPYLQNLPYTQQPVADIWNINLKMKSYLKRKLQ